MNEEDNMNNNELTMKLIDINENLINYIHEIMNSTNYHNNIISNFDSNILKISNDYNRKLKNDFKLIQKDYNKLKNEVLFLNYEKDYLLKKCDEYKKIRDLFDFTIEKNIRLIKDRIITNNKLILEATKNDILTNEKKELQYELNDLKNEYRCSICYENTKKIIIEPCYHFCCCEDCIDLIDKCPICRGEIAKIIRIY